MTQAVKPLTWIFGVVLTLVGVAGFFMQPVAGLFDVNVAHNVVHIASGIVALVAVSMSYRYARLYLMVFGVVYGLVAILGLLNVQVVTDLLMLNVADNYLHVAIALVCLVVGFGSGKTANAM